MRRSYHEEWGLNPELSRDIGHILIPLRTYKALVRRGLVDGLALTAQPLADAARAAETLARL